MRSGILLSACLIVKNEEANLDRCLKSIRKFVDEIVVVDTGSVDNTLAIAKHYGSRIHHHPWANDFSLHRNQAIEHARGKWIMVIDADEEFQLEPNATFGQIRDTLNRIDLQYPAAAITLSDMQKGMNTLTFSTTRFFRRGFVKYEGIVHNQPKVVPPNGQAVYLPFARIIHYGYDLTPEQKEAKFQRTSSLLLKQIEEGQVEDLFPYFYLCQCYANNGNNEDAVKWGERYWEERDKITEGHICESIYYTMAKQYMKLGDKEKAHEWITRGMEALPEDLDLALSALEYGVWVRDPNLQLNAANDYLRKYEQYQKDKDDPAWRKNRFVFSLRPEALAYVYLHKSIVCMTVGAKTMSKLFSVLETVPPQLKEGVLGELQEALAKTALPIQFRKKEVPPSTEDTGEKVVKFVTANLN